MYHDIRTAPAERSPTSRYNGSMRLIILLLSILSGSIAGVTTFHTLYSPTDSPKLLRMLSPERALWIPLSANLYSGTVMSVDLEKRTILVSIPNRWSGTGQVTVPMRFEFEPDAKWVFLEYSFRGEMLDHKTAKEARPRTLPVGTLISIVTDLRGEAFVARGIAYLGRSEL